MGLLKKFIPYECYKDIYEIDYNELYSQGIKIILYDLDNTISKYKEHDPSFEAISLMKKLKEIGFTVIVLSNNSYKRIARSVESLDVIGFAKARKPLKRGYEKVYKYLLENGLVKSKDEIVAIGDQIMTDVLGANRAGIKPILVNAIHLDDEKWYTKSNRRLENLIIKKMKKKYFKTFEKIRKCRGEKIEDKM